MKKLYLSIIFIQLLLVVLCSAPAAPEEWDFSGGILDRGEVLEKAARATREKYPEAAGLEIAKITKIRYNPDGTHTLWKESYSKYLSERVITDNPVASLSFVIPHQRGLEDCHFTLIEIIKPDGTVVSIDPEEETVVRVDRSDMEDNIYSQYKKIVEVGLREVEVGDILHKVSFERTIESFMPDNWTGGSTVQQLVPILSYIIEICGPEELPLRSMVIKNQVEGTVVSESRSLDDGFLCYRWEWKDVPSLFPEPNMPPFSSVKPRLLVSTLPDWKALSRWLSEVCEPHLQPDRAIRDKVEELTGDLEDPGEKLKALFLFVSQKIGYLGMAAEASDPGMRPHDVTATFKNRMGICRDQAALLVAMLREAGFEAFPTLISINKKVDPEVPLLVGIDHMIAAVREEDGDYLLMDPTTEATSAFISPQLNSKNYLVATPEGETILTSPSAPAENNTLEINTRGNIDRAGNLTAETVFRFNGVNDTDYRPGYAKARRADLFQYFQNQILKGIGDVSLRELVFEPEDLTDTSRPLTVRVKYRTDNFLVRGDDAVMVPLPSLASKIGRINGILDSCKLKKRKYPLVNRVVCGVRERITLDLDGSAGEVEALPSADPIDTETVSWKLSSRMEGGKLRVESDFQLKTPEFSPEEYLILRDTIQEAERDRRRMAIFAPLSQTTPLPETTPALSPPPAAVTATEKLPDSEKAVGTSGVLFFYKRFEYNLEDAYNWTETRSEKKQILGYSGIKSEGLLKIYNYYDGDKVEIEKAVVTGPDGSSKEVGEENISRYPKVIMVAFPGLEVGSTIEYRYTIKARDHILSESVDFVALDPTREIEVILKTPRDLPVTISNNNFQGVVSSQAPDPEDPARLVYEWKYEDLPILKPENSMPSLRTFNPSLCISTGNWSDYASRVEKTLTDAAGEVKPIKKEVSPRKKVEAVRDLADSGIRIENNTFPPFTSVTGFRRTFKKGVGTMADRAVVIYSLLKSAGLNPQFVLASSFPDIKEIREVLKAAPDLLTFWEVLVRVRDPELMDGRYVYLNDTDRYAALGATGHNGKLGLSLPEGEFIKISSAVEEGNKSNFEISLAADGSAVIFYRYYLYSNYADQKKVFSILIPEERRRMFEEQLGPQILSLAAELQGELLTDFSGYPGVVSFTARDPNFAIREGDFLFFQLSGVSSPVDNLPDERINPWFIDKADKDSIEIEVKLPPGFKVVYLPESLERKEVAGAPINVDLRTKEEVGPDGTGRLLINYRMEMEPAIVSPTAYQEIRKLFQYLGSRQADTVLLKKTTDHR